MVRHINGRRDAEKSLDDAKRLRWWNLQCEVAINSAVGTGCWCSCDRGVHGVKIHMPVDYLDAGSINVAST